MLLREAYRARAPSLPLETTQSLYPSERVLRNMRKDPEVLPATSGRHRHIPARRLNRKSVDLSRTGNSVAAKSRGVAAFTLLLSPDQFDLARPVTVVVNGTTVFDGVVQKDIRTLLTWAARDNDRTMLFAAELHIDLTRSR